MKAPSARCNGPRAEPQFRKELGPMNSSNLKITPLSGDAEIFNPNTPPTEKQIERAARFANWRVTARLTKHDRTVEFHEVPDRTDFVFRFPAVIHFRSWDNSILIALRHGANLADLKHMEAVVEQLKAGYFDLYPMVKRQGPRGRYWTLDLARTVHADDLAGTREFPRLITADHVAVRCDEPACMDFDSVHFHDGDVEPWYLHVHEVIETEGWSVSIERSTDDTAWSIHTDIDKWALTPRDASNLANDLMWATATAAKLNVA